ncbi:transmembrane protein 233 isoform X2 [Amblyraja radiata]|uniref:transmembrane protein 233 isoform X2 n=1 Tax=Amblyraja radiata TaxID=386614 RepID=UPI001403969F|nr:transmembrane protein 233 isoform X2 [Amblyraja radiata]
MIRWPVVIWPGRGWCRAGQPGCAGKIRSVLTRSEFVDQPSSQCEPEPSALSCALSCPLRFPQMSEAVNKSNLKQSLEEIDIAVSDPDNEAQEAKPPKRYLILTMLSCFCPSHPINIVAFVFAMMALNRYNEGDADAGKKLGHIATLVSIAAIIAGLIVIAIFCIVHFTTHQ